MKLKEEKGSITLFVVIAMFAFVLFSLATYTLLSRRSQTQTDLISEIKNIYDNVSEYDEYKSYFDGEIVPIYNAEELKKVGSGEKIAISKENGKIYTFSDTATYVLKNDIKVNEKWTPIGTEEKPFKGFFEGLGHKVSGLSIDSSSSNQGLFGVIDGGIISNLEVDGKVKSTSENIGGIVGKAKNAYIIRNCLNRVEVTGKSNVGGIIGEDVIEEGVGKILNCRNMAIITGESKVGGIIGISNGDILNSVNFSNIEATSDIVGGIVGLKNKNENSNLAGTLKMSYNIANVKGNSKVGGVVGTNNDIVENCYNTGIVEASNGYAGGIVGIQEGTEDTNKLLNSYSTGNIISTVQENVGGVIGSKSENSIVSKCIYIEGTAKGGVSGANIKNSAEVRSAEFMKTKYCVKDLGEENWKTISGTDYPVLYWQDGEKIELEFETVSTAQALKDFAHIVNDIEETFEEKTVTQLENIDLSSVCSATLGNWEPIGKNKIKFRGTYDGNNKIINNLYINSDINYNGLFAYIENAIIKNIYLENVDILGNKHIAGIVVRAENSTINNCHLKSGKIRAIVMVAGVMCEGIADIINCSNNVMISTTATEIIQGGGFGGIAARPEGGTISKCINTATIEGNMWVGGIVGINYCVTTNCYNTGNIIGVLNRARVGGISGIENASGAYGTIKNCYNIGVVDNNGGSYAGAIIGYTTSELLNCYYLQGTATLGGNKGDIIGQIEARSAEFMKSKYFVTELGEENWKIVSGVNDGYPILSWQDGEKIEPEFETVSTAQALKDFAHIVNDMGETFEGKTVTQLENIDLSSVCSETLGNWEPIGDYGTNNNLYFAGTYNGNSNAISNLYINSSNSYQGLFGYVINGNITSLNIDGNLLCSASNIGAISGCVVNGNITKCTNTARVEGQIAVSGIVGNSSQNNSITECTNNGIIVVKDSNSDGRYFGGILGLGSATITNCKNNGSVTGFLWVGGIVGYLNSERLENCTNTAKISGETVIGGIVGQADETVIRMCSNSGEVTSKLNISQNRSEVGGIASRIRKNIVIEKCKNTGTITANNSKFNGCAASAGGILGLSYYDDNSSKTIQLCSNYGKVNEISILTSSNSNYAGGIVGTALGGITIQYCYNTNTISGEGIENGNAQNHISGIAGISTGNVEIRNVYNIGVLSAKNKFVYSEITSTDANSNLKINNCYYLNTGTTGIDLVTGATLTGEAKAKTSNEMKNSAFLNEFTSPENWKIVLGINKGYPLLNWE